VSGLKWAPPAAPNGLSLSQKLATTIAWEVHWLCLACHTPTFFPPFLPSGGLGSWCWSTIQTGSSREISCITIMQRISILVCHPASNGDPLTHPSNRGMLLSPVADGDRVTFISTLHGG
jgi:hypothetical protein